MRNENKLKFFESLIFVAAKNASLLEGSPLFRKSTTKHLRICRCIGNCRK